MRARLRCFGLCVITLCLGLASVDAAAQADSPPTPPEPSAILLKKLGPSAYDRIHAQISGRGLARVIVRLESQSEPLAQLKPKQARSAIARLARRDAIARLQDRVLRGLTLQRARSVKRLKHIPYLALDVSESELEALAGLPEVAEIYEDRLLRSSLNVSVPQIGGDVAHLKGYTGLGQTVAILDTGVDSGHPALAGRVVEEACFSTTSPIDSTTSLCPNGSNPGGADEQFGPGAAINCTGVLGCDHGTHVAGIAASADPVYTGVAPDADLIAVQVFSRVDDFYACGYVVSSCLSAYTSDVIRGLDWVYDMRDSRDIAAVNLSLGTGLYATQAECDADFPGMEAAIGNLRAAGIATMVAAGNDGVAGALSSPACLSSAISVGAVDSTDFIPDFADTAPFLSLLAPGVGIVSTVPGGGFDSKTGTSMAAPHGTGSVALLGSVDPKATVDEILAAMTDTGVLVTDPIGGYIVPRIQVDAAADILAGPSLDRITLAAQPVISGLDKPVAIAHAGDGSGRLFIGLQDGRILIYDGTSVLPIPFLDLSGLVSCCQNRAGLLSIAFHPQYATNGRFYVNYVDTGGNIVVSRYTVSADPDVADPGSASPVLTAPGGEHHGGQLQFGPDGYLYVGFGDGASDGSVQNTAGDLMTLLGKMIRIDVDGGDPYTVPVDNPFVGDPLARGEIWASGLRNPWGSSFDRLTGDLYIADTGESALEEVNAQAYDSTGGEDYGWPIMEGTECAGGGSCDTTGLTLPVAEYDHTEGCAVTGGNVYRGEDYRRLQGVFLYGDYCSGEIWGLVHDDQGWQSAPLLDTPYEISAFGEDDAGNVYLADAAGGGVYLVKLSDLALQTASLPTGVIGVPYQATLGAAGGETPYTWTVTGGALPAGLTLDSASGVISGVPSGTGTSALTVQVQDAQFATVSRELELTITTPPPVIETTSLPDAVRDESYEETLAASSGTPPFTWTVASGALPPGLSLSADGIISGTPSSRGTYQFEVQVTDSEGLSDTQALTIVVKAVVRLTVGVMDTGQYGHLYGADDYLEEVIATFQGTGNDLTLSVVGYDIDYVDEVQVSLNGEILGYLSPGANDGLNAGDTFPIPAAKQLLGENQLSFKEVGTVGWKWGVTNLLLAEGLPPVIETTSLPDAVRDESYHETLSVSSGTAPFTWSLASGALPPGLSLSADGVISGTPSTGGTYDFLVRVTDSKGLSDTQALSITVNVVVRLTVGVTDTGQYGHLYGAEDYLEEVIATFQGTGNDLILSVVGYDVDYVDEVQVSLNGETLGYLSPGANDGLNGGDTFLIPAAKQLMGENQLSFKQALTVGWKWGVTNLLVSRAPPVITTTSLPDATSGQAYSETLSVSSGTAPFTWSVVSGALPPGLSLSADGVISGTPSTAGTYQFEVQVVDSANGSDTQTLTLQVHEAAVVLTVGVMNTGQYGHLYGADDYLEEVIATFQGTGNDLILSVVGYDVDYADEVQVSLNGETLGYLSPGANDGLNAGDTFLIPAAKQLVGENQLSFKQARTVGWKWGVTNLLLAAGLPPVIETTSLPNATRGQAYSETLSVSAGTAPFTWSVVSGALPPGLSLSAGGVISGTPSTAGDYQFEVQVVDSANGSDTQTLTLRVNEAAVALTVGIEDTGQYGHLYGAVDYLEELTATFQGTGNDLILSVVGYDVDFANEVQVSLNGETLGYLSPGANDGLNGGDTFTIPAAKQLLGENRLSFKEALTVGWKWGVTNLLLAAGLPPVIETTSLPNATRGLAYSETLSVSAGTAPFTWSVVSGALPPGLTLSADGVISGTPSTAGDYSFEVQVVDGIDLSDTQAVTLRVNEAAVALTVGIEDTGQYGHLYGAVDYLEELIATFQGTGQDLSLSVVGFDIDFGDEVQVSLNGETLGYLSPGANDGLNGGDTFTIPAAKQLLGENRLSFKQVNTVGWKWGVTDLLLE